MQVEQSNQQNNQQEENTPQFQDNNRRRNLNRRVPPRQTLQDNKDIIIKAIDSGFCDLLKLIQLIQRSGGDNEQLQKLIKKNKEKKLQKAQRFQEKQEKLKQNPKISPLEKYIDQFHTLVKKGVSNNMKIIIKALIKNDGNLEKSEEFIKQKESKRINRPDQKQGFEAYQEQIKTLILDDEFNYPMLIIKGLKQNNGDLEKTKLFIKSSLEKGQKNDRSERKFGRQNKENKEKRVKDHKREKYQKSEKDEELVEMLQNLKLEAWDNRIETLYIDANNLFFVNNNIRNMIIKDRKSGQKQAETVLTESFRQFFQKKQQFGLKNVRVIFDNTKLNVKEEGFIVESAMPKFSTSDDFLVDICANINPQNLKSSSLFVTSDQGLIKRLLEQGAQNIMKSGKFMSEVENVVDLQKIINQ